MIRRLAVLSVMGSTAFFGAPSAVAQTDSGVYAASTGNLQLNTLVRMGRRVTAEFTGQRMEDVLKFIQTYTGAEFDIKWADDRNAVGLDRDLEVSIKLNNISALTALERILETVPSDLGSESTWQLDRHSGALQIGPKPRLNKSRRTEIYDINDLLLEVPDYPEVPDIDLQNALQASQGGGGGGQNPFRDDQNEDNNEDRKSREDRAKEIVDLIIGIVEPDQWIDNGGDAATIRQWRGALIITAPDYVHRQINGYPFWPSESLVVGQNAQGHRWVMLNTDTGLSKIGGIANQPVSAVVGGQLIQSGPPGGGGE